MRRGDRVGAVRPRNSTVIAALSYLAAAIIAFRKVPAETNIIYG
jgi:hypothetical protein